MHCLSLRKVSMSRLFSCSRNVCKEVTNGAADRRHRCPLPLPPPSFCLPACLVGCSLATALFGQLLFRVFSLKQKNDVIICVLLSPSIFPLSIKSINNFLRVSVVVNSTCPPLLPLQWNHRKSNDSAFFGIINLKINPWTRDGFTNSRPLSPWILNLHH